MVKPVLSNHDEVKVYAGLVESGDYEAIRKYLSKSLQESDEKQMVPTFFKSFRFKPTVTYASFTQECLHIEVDQETTALVDVDHPLPFLNPPRPLAKGETVRYKEIAHLFFEKETGLMSERRIGLVLQPADVLGS